MKENVLLNENKRLYYRTAGSGPMVLLLHGFGEDGTVWENQYTNLQGYKWIIPDLPGSGQSEIIADMTMEGLADSIKKIIDHEVPGIEEADHQQKVCLIGHSMGGYVTLAFVEKYPLVIKAFGLFHSTAYADTEEKKKVRRKGIEFINTIGPFEFLKTATPNLFSPVTKEKNPGLIEEQIIKARNFSAAALVLYYNSMILRPDRTSVLKNSPFPVLFIQGKYDTAVPLKDGIEQCHLPDFSYIHILDSSGHMGMREQAAASNQILSDFLKSIYLTQ